MNGFHRFNVRPKYLLLTPSENKEFLSRLRQFNTEDLAFEPHQSIHDLFEEQVEKTPDTVAVVWNHQSLTYLELNRRANRIAHWLHEKHPGKGNTIGLCCDRSFDMVVGILAILKAGHAYVPFDPSYPADRIQYMIRQSGIAEVLLQEKFKPVFNHTGTHLQGIDGNDDLFAPFPGTNLSIKSDPTSPAYVLFTSGSTGDPKGVVQVHRALVNLLQWQKNKTPLNTAARTLQFAPVSFDVSFQELFTTWTTGGVLLLIDDEMRLNAIRLLQFIGEQKVERLFLPFIALQHLAEVAVNSKLFPEPLRDVITAGEQLQITPHIREFFLRLPGCRLHNHYGPTETHVVTALTLPDDPQKWPALPSIGKPVAHTHVYLLDENLHPVTTDSEGEIYIAGASLANGYINRDDLTNERFIKNPFSKTGNDRLYKTGDLGRYLSDGQIEYLGRTDTQVKVRGYRIELGEIEIALQSFPGITQAAVTVREDQPGDKRLIAYYAGNAGLSHTEIRKHLAARLPGYMMPSSLVRMEALPRTPSGKVDRRALPEPDSSRPEGVLFVAPQTEDEKAATALWSQLLHISPVGVTDHFFDFGGNSLLALQFIARMRQQTGMDIPVVKLYQYPTISGLFRALQTDATKTSPLEDALKRFEKTFHNHHGAVTVEDGIAIIGMSGRFPGADSVEVFWQNLVEGKETVSFFSDSELDPSIPAEQKNDPLYVKARGVLNDAFAFDAPFFGVNPKLAQLTDPQQRVFLQVCWEALEDSGYGAGYNKGLVGVFAGMGNNTYYTNNVIHHRDSIEKTGPFQVMVANEKDYIATRVSHFMNLKGPGVSVHTACSTSLTAVALACQSLWDRHCDMAIAGGVAITSPVNSGHLYQEGAMFSADGHTRPFDEKATGTVFSDGAGVVVLKRYRDAVADGDTIYAVIRGAGINNDGSEKASFTAPSVEGQAAAIAMALAQAQVSPETITCVEAHGTATPLGDPIEVEALTLAYGKQKKQYCALGSVKSNIGHLTAAAGVAGLIKMALSLRNGVIPPTINYNATNKAIDFSTTPFFVNAELRPWKGSQRRGGVSSFGVGGTNVHLVLEEAPATTPSGASRSHHLLMLSAKNSERLEESSALLNEFLKTHPDVNLADAAYTLQTGRTSFNSRKFIVCNTVTSAFMPTPVTTAQRELSQPASGVVFLFPGQGSQYVNMGYGLYRDEIVYKEAVDRCSELLFVHLEEDIRTILFPDAGNEKAATEKLQQTKYTQPALFITGYALAKLWMSWGITPVALAGHSIGEFCAACIAGIMSLEEALMLVSHRGMMMQQLPGGSMLSIRTGAAEVQPWLNPSLSIAAINGPSLCVVSGDHVSVEKLQQQLEAKEIVCKKLLTSHAFHSPMMDPIVAPFEKLVAGVKLNAPSIPVISTATAQLLSVEEATNPRYWSAHLRKPVLFADAIRTLWEQYPSRFLLELGPRNTATTLARQQAQDLKKQFAFPSLADTAADDKEWQTMLYAIGQLWLSGIHIQWDDFYLTEKRKKISLPTYPFEKKRYLVEPGVTQQTVATFHPYQPFNEAVPVNISSNQSTMNRKNQIIATLKQVMEEASGIDLSTAGVNSSFMELGMDSLFLTQAALTISKKYGTKVTFRQLNEDLSSLDALATHLDRVLPSDAVPATPQPLPMPAVSAPVTGQNDQLQWLIMQQMQFMQQQLAALNHQPVQQTNSIPQAKPEGVTNVSESEKADLEKPFGAIARIEKTVNAALSNSQRQWLSEFTKNYTQRTARSKAYTQEHRAHLADPRVVSGFKPALKELIYQAVVNRSEGCRMWDLDGNEYIDVLNGFGSNFLGYGNPVVIKAVEEQLKNGIEIGPQHPLAGEMTRLICEFSGYDRAGLCNTGSEAVLGAMRIARTVTGRNTIVCFNGSYHGINDEVIVRGTRKLKSFPAAAGIPAESVQNMLVLDYGTDEALKIIRERAGEIAAVLVEPIQSRRADFRPKEFLQEVRKITSESGALLIFDEVITGFRLLPRGAQEFYGIDADVSTYGKVIGGGMPIGAIAGKKEYMDALDGGFWQFGDSSVPETGVTYFAGTFVRHPLALAAGVAVLRHLKERGMELYNKLNGLTDHLVSSVNAHCKQTGAPFHLVNFGSLFKMKWDEEQPYGELIFLLLRFKGVHIYDGFPCFLTDAFSQREVEFVIEKFKEATDELQATGFLTGNHTPVNGSIDSSRPPMPGARLGKDASGQPAWFVPDPNRPGKFLMVGQ